MSSFTDDVQKRCIDLTAKVSAIAPNDWDSATQVVGETRSQEQFNNDVIAVFQKATAMTQSSWSFNWAWDDLGIGVLETQFKKILDYVSEGGKAAIEAVVPFTQGAVTTTRASVDVSGYWQQKVGEGARWVIKGVVGDALEDMRKKLGMEEDKFYSVTMLVLVLMVYMLYRQL